MKAQLHSGLIHSLKNLALAALALAFVHCGNNLASVSGAEPDKIPDDTNGAVKSTLLLGKVGALRKEAGISLKKLYVIAISSATPADTVIDSTTISGSDAQSVVRVLTLKPLRNWIISAKTLDMKDSIIHMGSSASFFVKPADTADVSLNLASRFAMYQANFSTLPDSVFSTQSGTGKDKLNLNRLVLKVDGQVMSDSALAKGFFTVGQNVNVYFDYITPGAHTVTLEAFGSMHTYSGILFSGSTGFSVSAGIDEAKTVNLNWVGPTTGSGKLTVTLGKVGKVIITGGISAAIL